MKKIINKTVKMLLYILLILLVVVLLVTTIYLNFSPQVGGAAVEHNSNHKLNGRFQNLITTPLSTGDKSMLRGLFEFFFRKNPDAFPKSTIETKKVDVAKLQSLKKDEVLVTWLGHSTVLISTEGLNIITDPVLNSKRIPPMYLGPKPFPYANSYQVEDLPKIDLVLISHDHYDHLDMETIKQLRTAKFYVPLGVSEHLKKWGVEQGNITEMDWYQDTEYLDKLKLSFVPARHFSGRGLLNRNTTLWGSWVLNLSNKKLYFGGDSGYFEEFQKIGKLYGPFDLAALDCGQYDESWNAVHMLPHETAQAGLDLRAKYVFPIHNSKYILANHAWHDPLGKVTQEARKKNLELATPRPGQSFSLDQKPTNEVWWK